MTVLLASRGFWLMDHPMIFLSNRSMMMVRYSHPCLVLTKVMLKTILYLVCLPKNPCSAGFLKWVYIIAIRGCHLKFLNDNVSDTELFHIWLEYKIHEDEQLKNLHWYQNLGQVIDNKLLKFVTDQLIHWIYSIFL